MCFLHNPSAGLEIGIVFLFLNRFPALLDVWDVTAIFDSLLGWLASITLICTEVLYNAIEAIDHDSIKHSLELGDVMLLTSDGIGIFLRTR